MNARFEEIEAEIRAAHEDFTAQMDIEFWLGDRGKHLPAQEWDRALAYRKEHGLVSFMHESKWGKPGLRKFWDWS